MVVIFRKANKRDPVGLLRAYVPQMSIAPHPIKMGSIQNQHRQNVWILLFNKSAFAWESRGID